MYILITAANSAQAHQLKNKLNQPNVILGDYEDLPDFMLKAGNVIKLPNPNSVSYAHQMLTLCLDKEIDTVYALRDGEMNVLKQSEQLFSEYGITIVNNVPS